MTTNPFAAPAPVAGGISWADHKGRLLIVEPLSYESGIKTTFGETDAVRANVHVVDGPNPQAFEDTLIFGRVLIAQTRPRIGQKVLGRLTTLPAKTGQSAPWALEEATPADIQAGTEYLTRYQSGQFTTPAADAAAPPF